MGRQFNENWFKTLRRPRDDKWAKVADDHNLSSEQLWELKRSVDKAIADCAVLQERMNIPDRDILIAKADKIRSLLSELEKEIDLGRRAVDLIGLPNNLGMIGRLLSFEAVRDATHSTAFDREVRPTLDLLERSSASEITILELEWELALKKQMIDRNRRSDLLLHAVRTMRHQFSDWLRELVPDPGGAPANPVRRVMLFSLACDASRILGPRGNKPAIYRAGGTRFIKLCNDVCNLCGIDTEALESAIRNLLKKDDIWAVVCHHNEFQRGTCV